jgi:hypothetical protein
MATAGPVATAAHGAARGHRGKGGLGGTVPTGDMDDEVQGGGRLEFVEVKGNTLGMDGKAGAHRCASAPARWQKKGQPDGFRRRRGPCGGLQWTGPTPVGRG